MLDRIAQAQVNGDCGSKLKPEELRLPLFDWDYLEQLAGSANRSSESSQKLDFEHGLANGYFLLKLNDDDANIMRGLWECAKDIFALESIPLRHQTLVRDDAGTTPDASGYKYIETTKGRCDGTLVLLPDDDIIEMAIGKDRKDILSKAYNMLGNIGRLTTAALLKASAREPYTTVDELMNMFPDSGQVSERHGDEDSDLSCTMQRICCYSSLSETAGFDEMETLRGHADWTIMTLVPHSAVSGLEIWDPCLSTWVRPEAADKVPIEHFKYITVMAGKWLELLSMGRIPAAIHRVIASKERNRLSTPFFYRPRQYIPSLLQAKHGIKSTEIEGTSQEVMGKFLLEVCCSDKQRESK